MDPEEYASIYRLEQTHWWYVGMRRIALTLLEAHLPGKHGLMVLDAGCGTGGMMLALERYGRVFGVDFSPLALRFCQQRGLDRAFQASVTALPFPSAAFDLVTSFDVLYHLGVSDDTEALREFSRVLRPGGLLLLRLPALEWLRSAHDHAVHTRHRYTAPEVKAKVAAAGFRVLRATYGNTLLFPIAAGARLAQRLMGRGQRAASDVQETAEMANRALSGVLALEARLLRRVDLPVGLSVICLAQKR